MWGSWPPSPPTFSGPIFFGSRSGLDNSDLDHTYIFLIILSIQILFIVYTEEKHTLFKCTALIPLHQDHLGDSRPQAATLPSSVGIKISVASSAHPENILTDFESGLANNTLG